LAGSGFFPPENQQYAKRNLLGYPQSGNCAGFALRYNRKLHVARRYNERVKEAEKQESAKLVLICRTLYTGIIADKQ
jgi:hypothetical protein